MNINQTDIYESQSHERQIFSGHSFAIYRGFSGPHYGVDHIFLNPYLEKPREPRYYTADKQARIGKWFENKFKIDYWNTALFATGSLSFAKDYAGEHGSVGLLEPDEESSCSICWSPDYVGLFGILESRPQIPLINLLEEGRYEVFMWQDEQKRREAILTGNELMVFAPRFKVAEWLNP